jgi:hypothetical protein
LRFASRRSNQPVTFATFCPSLTQIVSAAKQ